MSKTLIAKEAKKVKGGVAVDEYYLARSKSGATDESFLTERRFEKTRS